jgi:hypothetical protein
MTNDAKPAQGKSWRDVLPVHPAADLFPLMSPDELKALGEDIKKNGMQLPVAVWAADANSDCYFLLDGRNRLDAMEAVDLKVIPKDWEPNSWPFRDRVVSELLLGCGHMEVAATDPYEYVLSVNIHRRHLNAEQKRDLIAKVIKAKPEASNRQIAKQVKADDKTVGKVRREMEATADIPQFDRG